MNESGASPQARARRRWRWAIAWLLALLVHIGSIALLRPPDAGPVPPTKASQDPFRVTRLELPPPVEPLSPTRVPEAVERAAPTESAVAPEPTPQPEPALESAPEPTPELAKADEDAEPEASDESLAQAESEAEPDTSPARGPVPFNQRGPRRVTLFSPQAVDSVAPMAGVTPHSDRETERERVQRRLASWDRESKRRTAHKHVDFSPGTRALGTRLHAWFTPPQESIATVSAGEGESWADAVLAASPMAALIAEGEDADWLASNAADSWSLAMDLMSRISGDSIAGGGPAIAPMGCFGACGQDHDVAELHVIIEVDHDEIGLPKHWRIVRSSGSGPFDNAALAAVGDVVDWAAKDEITDTRAAQQSRWLFSATTYRWSRSEVILDPQWTPPGRELSSGLLSQTTWVKSVRLVSVRYRKP